MLSLLGSLRRGNFVQRSLRFRSSASAYLSRTPSLGDRRTWTWSGWVKRGTIGVGNSLLACYPASTTDTIIVFDAADAINIFSRTTGTIEVNKTTSAVYRDPSAWYHIVVHFDTNNSTVEDRVKLYVNGSRVTSFSTNTSPSLPGYQGYINFNYAHDLGRNTNTGGSPVGYFDGYLTEVNFIDGQALTPSSFGQIESTTGVWSPKQYAGSYGTNGFYLKFGNTSSVAALGNDSSGNGNTWTVNNVSLTAGVTYDSMLDVPVNYSDSGNGRGNYCTLNPLDKLTTATLAAANLETTSAAAQNIIGSMSMDSGSWYWEIAYSAATASQLVGVYKAAATTVSVTPTTSVIGLRFNADTGALDYTVNGSTYTSIATGLTGGGYFPYAGSLTNAKVIYANFGQRPFTYTPPSGFRALNTNNLPTPSIVNGANFMAATTYTGNGAVRSLSNAVNNVSFQPNLVWIKSRTPGATSHALFDSVRGATRYLSSNTTAIEVLNANTLPAFTADGFSLGTDTTLVNASANSYVAWQWKAGGAAVSNTQGTITSQVSANTTAGVSVVTYTGNGTAGATVGHGLGVMPAMVIYKSTSTTTIAGNWIIWHKSIGQALFQTSSTIQLNGFTNAIYLNLSIQTNTYGFDSQINESTKTYVAYCFSEIAGFSKFGSYSGVGTVAGSIDGTFVYTGFRPAYVMVKRTDTTGAWCVWDKSRSPFNVMNETLFPNTSGVEFGGGGVIDFTSNGFKLRYCDPSYCFSGGTYIFAAFAEVPSKYALAR